MTLSDRGIAIFSSACLEPDYKSQHVSIATLIASQNSANQNHYTNAAEWHAPEDPLDQLQDPRRRVLRPPWPLMHHHINSSPPTRTLQPLLPANPDSRACSPRWHRPPPVSLSEVPWATPSVPDLPGCSPAPDLPQRNSSNSN